MQTERIDPRKIITTLVARYGAEVQAGKVCEIHLVDGEVAHLGTTDLGEFRDQWIRTTSGDLFPCELFVPTTRALGVVHIDGALLVKL